MSILLLGHTGKLGLAFQRYFKEKEIPFQGLNSTHFDARNPQTLTPYLEQAHITTLINTVAMNGINPCAHNPKLAYALNADFPQFLTRQCHQRNQVFIHISTEAVFGGKPQKFFYEDDLTAPLNTYGLSKEKGESLILQENPSSFIFRLPLLYGPLESKNQVLERIILKILSREPVWLNDEIKTSPTFVEDLPPAILSTQENFSAGIYHLSNTGEMTVKGFITKLMDTLNIQFDEIPDKPDSITELEPKALKTILSSRKLKPLRSVEEALQDYAILVQNFLERME